MRHGLQNSARARKGARHRVLRPHELFLLCAAAALALWAAAAAGAAQARAAARDRLVVELGLAGAGRADDAGAQALQAIAEHMHELDLARAQHKGAALESPESAFGDVTNPFGEFGHAAGWSVERAAERLLRGRGWWDFYFGNLVLRAAEQPPDFGLGTDKLASWLPGQEKAYLQEFWEPVVSCAFERRVGKPGDGGKWACDPDQLLQRGRCAVVSVGSEDEWSFEEAVLQRYSCDFVHTFDHTVLAPHPPPGATFHQLKLGAAHRPKEMQTSVQGILDLLPTGRQVDIMKIDIEGGEYFLLAHNASLDALASRVRVLMFEMHMCHNFMPRPDDDWERLCSVSVPEANRLEPWACADYNSSGFKEYRAEKEREAERQRKEEEEFIRNWGANTVDSEWSSWYNWMESEGGGSGELGDDSWRRSSDLGDEEHLLSGTGEDATLSVRDGDGGADDGAVDAALAEGFRSTARADSGKAASAWAVYQDDLAGSEDVEASAAGADASSEEKGALDEDEADVAAVKDGGAHRRERERMRRQLEAEDDGIVDEADDTVQDATVESEWAAIAEYGGGRGARDAGVADGVSASAFEADDLSTIPTTDADDKMPWEEDGIYENFWGRNDDTFDGATWGDAYDPSWVRGFGEQADPWYPFAAGSEDPYLYKYDMRQWVARLGQRLYDRGFRTYHKEINIQHTDGCCLEFALINTKLLGDGQHSQQGAAAAEGRRKGSDKKTKKKGQAGNM